MNKNILYIACAIIAGAQPLVAKVAPRRITVGKRPARTAIVSRQPAKLNSLEIKKARELVTAIRKNDLDTLVTLLIKHPKIINYTTPNKKTLFNLAAKNKVVLMLLKKFKTEGPKRFNQWVQQVIAEQQQQYELAMTKAQLAATTQYLQDLAQQQEQAQQQLLPPVDEPASEQPQEENKTASWARITNGVKGLGVLLAGTASGVYHAVAGKRPAPLTEVVTATPAEGGASPYGPRD